MSSPEAHRSFADVGNSEVATVSHSKEGGSVSGITHFEITLKTPFGDIRSLKEDKLERDSRNEYQKFLRAAYWFLLQGETAIPGISMSTLSGLQQMREEYAKTKSIADLKVPTGCSGSLKIAKYDASSAKNDDYAIILWVVQRARKLKGVAGALIPQPESDPEIPPYSIGARIPLTGNPIPKSMLLKHPHLAEHFPQISPHSPTLLVDSPEVQKAREDAMKAKFMEEEMRKAEEDRQKAEAAKERRIDKSALQAVRTSSRVPVPKSIMAPVETAVRKRKLDFEEDNEATIRAQLPPGFHLVLDDDEVAETVAPRRTGRAPKVSAKKASTQRGSVSERTAGTRARSISSTTPTTNSDDEMPQGKEGRTNSKVNSRVNPKVAKSPADGPPPKKRARGRNDTAETEKPQIPPRSLKRTRRHDPAATAVDSDDEKTAAKRARVDTSTMVVATKPLSSGIGRPRQRQPLPPVPKGQKPKSRIARKCVNCGHESSMEWRNQDTSLRNDCEAEDCGKKRDKRY